jgi:hypothetical protein
MLAKLLEQDHRQQARSGPAAGDDVERRRSLADLLAIPPGVLPDEIREKIFKNYALKSINTVRAKLKQAILYIERNPKTVKSITSFPYIVRSL